MDQYSEKTWVLLTRKLSGELTPEETIRFQQWLNEAPENRAFYNRLKSSWDLNPGESVDSFSLSLRFNSKKGLEKLRDKLVQEEDSVKQKSNVVFKNRIKNKKSSGLYIWKLAASILVIAMTSIVYLVTTQDWDQPATTTYTTTDVEQRIITLSDGTVVRLNRNSTLEVSDDRSDESRMIWLDGEAFFDVTHNPDRTFIVHAGDAVVEVLGTSFNVKRGNEVIVAVEEGLVSFRHQSHEERSAARLTAGQLGMFSEGSNDVKIEETDIENYLSWKNGYLNFSSMPFDQVLRQLERIYGVTHDLQDGSEYSHKLTVYTEKVQLEEVVETISIALDLGYEMHESTIKWYRNETVSE
jgi:transmembrane sensor